MPDQRKTRDERRKQIIDVWKTIVDVQQHFNDISMRIRSLFVTILLALFASLGFLIDKKLSLKISVLNVQFATLMPLFGILGTYLFYFIDRYWYHRLLIGSVKHAITIETKYKNEMPELSLSEAIGVESPYRPQGLTRLLACLLVRHKKYRDTGLLHSDGKIEFFYKLVALALFLTTVLLASLGGINIDKGASSATRTTSVAPTPFLSAPAQPVIAVPSPISPLLAPRSSLENRVGKGALIESVVAPDRWSRWLLTTFYHSEGQYS